MARREGDFIILISLRFLGANLALGAAGHAQGCTVRSISLEHARSIVSAAEDHFSRGVTQPNYFAPFKSAGAQDRVEAIHAIQLAIAEYRLTLPEIDGIERAQFDKYVRGSQSIVLGIILGSGASAEEQAECMEIESIESFVLFLDSSDIYGPTYWAEIFQRIGLQQETIPVRQKSWWQIW